MYKKIILIVFALVNYVISYSQATQIDNQRELINEIRNEFQTFMKEMRETSNQMGYILAVPAEESAKNLKTRNDVYEKSIPNILPIKSKPKISSSYGFRQDPFTKKRAFHHGIDIVVPKNTDVLSCASGIVIKAGYDKYGGKYIKINHNNKYQTLYGHLSKILVNKGETVRKGQLIGKSGNTGRSTGPHIHYQVYFDGKTINPLSLIY